MGKFFNIASREEEKQEDDIEIKVEEPPKEPEKKYVGQVALDIIETGDAMLIIAPLAGMDRNEVSVELSKNVLIISGTRTKPIEYTQSAKILVAESFFGSFSRTVILPENLNFQKTTATMEHNMLVIRIQKLEFDSKSVRIDHLTSVDSTNE